MPQPTRDQVFISYSHKDKRWRGDLDTNLKPYLRGGSIVSWSDDQISPGSQWFTEIETALTKTRVAVLLVSPDFLASDFIHEREFGPLLKEAEQGGVKILWIPIRESAYKQTPLKNYQAVLEPAKPLAAMTKAKRDFAWVCICEEIQKAVNPTKDPFPEDAPIPAVPKATLLNIPDLNPLLATFLGAMEEILGRENRYLAKVLNGLGGLYEAVGRYAKAKPLYERALGIYEKSLGPEHPNVAITLENYAVLLRKVDRPEEAALLESRAKAIRAKNA